MTLKRLRKGARKCTILFREVSNNVRKWGIDCRRNEIRGVSNNVRKWGIDCRRNERRNSPGLRCFDFDAGLEEREGRGSH